MAKLYFYYSAMNAGKTTTLLQSAYNYEERGLAVQLFTPQLDDRYQVGLIRSRIGLEREAIAFASDYDFYAAIDAVHKRSKLACILVDEAQFLSSKQVDDLADVVDLLSIPVLAYGIRTDFLNRLFPGSQALLAIADELIELKTICACGRKATTNPRFDGDGKRVKSGPQVEIGGNDRYITLCRRCYKKN